MKRFFAVLLTLVMALTLLSACNGGGTPSSPADVKGEVFDAGSVKALVPSGWTAFPVSDIFDDYETDNDPTKIQICKGAKSEWDLFTNPYVQITLYPDHTMAEPSTAFYENVVNLDPITTGKYTWNAFTADSMDYNIATLWTDMGDIQLLINAWLSNPSSDLKISLDDADVRAILESIEY